MVQRLDGPITLLKQMNGPVRIGRLDDDTLLIAGPNDQPILIRHGAVMTLKAHKPNGDLEFGYNFVDYQLKETT